VSGRKRGVQCIASAERTKMRDADILAGASTTRDEFDRGRDYATGDKACSQAVLCNR